MDIDNLLNLISFGVNGVCGTIVAFSIDCCLCFVVPILKK
ncbi:hypothetical protein PL9214520335 [Planktothrix tepida PCC 9214]|uniref:Uncharacterized protein n=1 Tax=Planktothrix tepida PCC 9214 TaxID=671072 RepID=A0A1J1LPF5_9CYAN|nr:hypothetical protein PL9214520335 [Planktothrix tepida PCC 9214]